MQLIDRALGQLFRSLEGTAQVSNTSKFRFRPRTRTQLPAPSPTDLKPEYIQRIGGLSMPDFKLLVLIPAIIVRLIQADEESRLGTRPTFEEAVEIAKRTRNIGELLYPDDDDEEEAPLSVEYVAERLFVEKDTESDSSETDN